MSENLRELLSKGNILVAPGAYDALSALLIRKGGFRSVYVSGASSSYFSIGMPDLGFMGMVDGLEETAQSICHALLKVNSHPGPYRMFRPCKR